MSPIALVEQILEPLLYPSLVVVAVIVLKILAIMLPLMAAVAYTTLAERKVYQGLIPDGHLRELDIDMQKWALLQLLNLLFCQ